MSDNPNWRATSVFVGFRTPGKNFPGHNDKDDDTVIHVRVYGYGTSVQIGQFDGYGGGADGTAKQRYSDDNDGSYYAVPLTLDPNYVFRQVDGDGLDVSIWIRTTGSDTWVFEPKLIVSTNFGFQNVEYTPQSTRWSLSDENPNGMKASFYPGGVVIPVNPGVVQGAPVLPNPIHHPPGPPITPPWRPPVHGAQPQVVLDAQQDEDRDL